MTLSLVGEFSLTERLSLVGLAGAMYSDSDMQEVIVTTSSNCRSGQTVSKYNEQDSSWFAGAGPGLQLSERINLRLMYKYYPAVNEQVYGKRSSNNTLVRIGDFDFQQASVNLLYRFWCF